MKNMYKLSLLGCASCCLMSIAQANPVTNETSELVFLEPLPTVLDVVCGAAPRNYTYTVKNIGDDPVTLDGAKVFVDSLSPIPNDLVTLKLPSSSSECFYTAPAPVLPAGAQCNLVVVVDPTDISLSDCDPLVQPISVDAELELYANNWQREIETEFGFDITPLGSAEDFAIVGTNICNDDDDDSDENCTDDPSEPRIFDGVIQSWNNTAATAPGVTPTTNILYADPDNMRMYTNPADLTVVTALVADINAAIINFTNAAGVGCTQIPADAFQSDWSDGDFEPGDPVPSNPFTAPGAPINVNPGIYCYDEEVQVGNYPSNPPFVVDLDLRFTCTNAPSCNDQLYVFVVESEDYYTLLIDFGANFDVVSNNVNPDNIYWIVNGGTPNHEEGGNVEIVSGTNSGGTSFVGNILATGYFESDQVPSTSVPQITGRILSLKDVILPGATVSSPYTTK